MARLPALLLAGLLLALPQASAEFGPESEDGWPINVDGEVLRPPVRPVLAQQADPLNKMGPFTVYPYYPLLTAEVQRLAAERPDLVKVTSAGRTAAGLNMWLLEIADFANATMKPLEERETLLVDGGTHSNEYSGVYFVTELAQFLVEEYDTNETARWIVENRHTFLMPMVNPDGSHAFGRLNAHLVNINRNYPVVWDGEGHDPLLNNRGPAPASEPETRAVIDLLNLTRPDYYASIHCCGNLWLYPYGEQGVDPLDNAMYARICDEAYADVRKSCGPIWSTIYPASGSSVDTAYEYTGAVSWGFEMSGRGAVAPWGQPAIVDDVREQERESWAGVMHAFLHVEKYGARPVVDAIEGDAGLLRVTVRNEGWGNLTAGNLTVGGRSVALPFLASGGSAVVEVEGAFAEGPLPVRLEWQKRVMAAPTGVAGVDALLVREGDALRGFLPGMDVTLAGGAVPPSDVPGPGLAAILLAVALLGVLRRRRA